MKLFYRRNLPHIQPVGSCIFVTARLHNSFPYATIHCIKERYERSLANIDLIKSLRTRNYEKLKVKKQNLLDVDQTLHSIKTGPHHLKNEKVSAILAE